MDKFNNYRVYRISKGNGKYRKISEPNEELKKIQSDIATMLDSLIKDTEYAVGFVKRVGLTEGVKRHIDSKVILNMDIKSFFDNIKWDILEEEIRNAFKVLNYSDELIGNKIKSFPRLAVEVEGFNIDSFLELIHKACFFREATPQGSPASPKLSNLYMRSFDYRMNEKIQALGEQENQQFTFTRYVDDITIGCQDDSFDMWECVKLINKELKELGLYANRKKTNILRQNKRQEITGLALGQLSNLNHSTIMWIEAFKHKNGCFLYLKHLQRGHVAISWSKRRRETLRAKLHNIYLKLTNGETVAYSNLLKIQGELSMLYANDKANFFKYKKELDKIYNTGLSHKVKSLMTFRSKMLRTQSIKINIENDILKIDYNNLFRYQPIVIQDKENPTYSGIKQLEEKLKQDGYAIRTRNSMEDYIMNGVPVREIEPPVSSSFDSLDSRVQARQ